MMNGTGPVRAEPGPSRTAGRYQPRCWRRPPSDSSVPISMPGHGLAELARRGGNALGIVVVGGRLDDRPGAALRGRTT